MDSEKREAEIERYDYDSTIEGKTKDRKTSFRATDSSL